MDEKFRLAVWGGTEWRGDPTEGVFVGLRESALFNNYSILYLALSNQYLLVL